MCVDEKVEDLISLCDDEGLYSSVVGYKEDLHKVHMKIDKLARRLPNQTGQDRPVRWYGNPLLLVIVGVIGSGLVSYLVAHWEVNQTREDVVLDQRIDNHIDSKLQPITEGIAKLREDVAYLRAKVEDVTTKKITGFSNMPINEVG